MPVIRRAVAAVAVCAALAGTAACGSDSSGSDSASAPSQSQSELIAKLKSEPELNKGFDQLGKLSNSGQASAKVDELKSKLYPCFAKGLQSSASADKLRAYVDGNQEADKILTAAQQKKFEAATKSCLSSVLPK